MLNSWGFSSMGFGVCSVLGAQLAAPDRPCISVCGDGGFTMTPYVVVHRGRVRPALHLGGLEQLHLGGDPRHPGRHVRRPRARHGVLPRPGPQEALQPGLRRLGARLRRRRRHGDEERGPARRAASRRSATGAPACSTCTWTPKCGRPRPAPGSCRRRRSRNRCSASRGWPDMSDNGRQQNRIGIRRLARHRRRLRAGAGRERLRRRLHRTSSSEPAARSAHAHAGATAADVTDAGAGGAGVRRRDARLRRAPCTAWSRTPASACRRRRSRSTTRRTSASSWR